MDNHRLSLWCWVQQLDQNQSYNLFHIDAHPDMAVSANEIFSTMKIDLWNLSLKDYRNIIQPEYNIPLFRWDNYLQVLLKHYPQTVKKINTFSATHKVGSDLQLAHDISPYRLLSELKGIFTEQKYINENKWIVNLDLDYFYSSLPDKILMFGTEYLEEIAVSIKTGLDSGLIKVCTIALSPECCGGWEKAETTLSIFTRILQINEVLLAED
jgi:hypothetical protein